MKLKAGKVKRQDFGAVSPEVADYLQHRHMQRKLEKLRNTPSWKLAAATATNRFILIGKPT